MFKLTARRGIAVSLLRKYRSMSLLGIGEAKIIKWDLYSWHMAMIDLSGV